jgi:hypothetical protein
MSDEKIEFRCKRCRLLAYPAGYPVPGRKGQSEWISYNNGYCITCNPLDNYAKPTTSSQPD